MNKNELISAVAKATDFTKTDTKKVIEATFDAIVDSLVDGNDVAITKFGTFKLDDVAERDARNPQTGKVIGKVPAHKAPKFKFSKTVKDAVR